MCVCFSDKSEGWMDCIGRAACWALIGQLRVNMLAYRVVCCLMVLRRLDGNGDVTGTDHRIICLMILLTRRRVSYRLRFERHDHSIML